MLSRSSSTRTKRTRASSILITLPWHRSCTTRELRDRLGVTRPILVDALDRACHRAYGSMPNTSWIFAASGIPVYKSDWTDPASLANAVEYILDVQARRTTGERLASFHVERLDFRHQDHATFYAALARNGPKAVREYRAAFG